MGYRKYEVYELRSFGAGGCLKGGGYCFMNSTRGVLVLDSRICMGRRQRESGG